MAFHDGRESARRGERGAVAEPVRKGGIYQESVLKRRLTVKTPLGEDGHVKYLEALRDHLRESPEELAARVGEITIARIGIRRPAGPEQTSIRITATGTERQFHALGSYTLSALAEIYPEGGVVGSGFVLAPLPGEFELPARS